MDVKTVLRSTRPSFLLLTPVCVFLAYSVSSREYQISNSLLALVLIGAILAHIAVNMLNEYQDFRSGLDLATIKTPFSGGSGALPDHPEAAQHVLIGAIFSLGIVASIGLLIVYRVGIKIIPIGLFGIAIIMLYTRWINRRPYLCLLAPGAGLGLLMVLGTYVTLTGQYSYHACLVSLVPFFLVNNLLLLNQYPDIEADKQAGRNHFPIAFGIKRSNQIFLLFAFCAYIPVVLLLMSGYLSRYGLIVLLPLLLSLYAYVGARRFGAEIGKHPSYMAANVGASLLTPLLFAIIIMSG